VWTADFKGHFRTRDSLYCYPLTVKDGFSRFLLGCKGLLSTEHEGVEPVFERLFREYGLPGVIRTDNGVPFATQAIRRLSRLAVWWIKLGIVPELIEPGHPEQNGRHERMHRTLKAETAKPPAANLRAQQRVFDRFRREYNEERPHEAIGQRTPASLYHPSARAYPDKLPAIEYPGHFEVRRVSRNGGVRWRCHRSQGPGQPWLNVSHVLAGEYVGLEEVDTEIWSVYFGSVLLGRFDEREMKIYGAHPENRPL
jgi:putative transposase